MKNWELRRTNWDIKKNWEEPIEILKILGLIQNI